MTGQLLCVFWRISDWLHYQIKRASPYSCLFYSRRKWLQIKGALFNIDADNLRIFRRDNFLRRSFLLINRSCPDLDGRLWTFFCDVLIAENQIVRPNRWETFLLPRELVPRCPSWGSEIADCNNGVSCPFKGSIKSVESKTVAALRYFTCSSHMLDN